MWGACGRPHLSSGLNINSSDSDWKGPFKWYLDQKSENHTKKEIKVNQKVTCKEFSYIKKCVQFTVSILVIIYFFFIIEAKKFFTMS